jgi:ABC-type uncharacterized transport system involved in gliding motility auxiliary subunit
MRWDRQEVAKFIGASGAALLFAGYLRYSTQREMQLLSKILLIGGGVLVLAAIGLGFQSILNYFSKRSSQLGTNTSILALAVIAVLVIVNFLGFEHHKRFDLTSERLFTLSGQTKKIVSGLKNDVTIVRFSKTPDQRFNDLMIEYRSLSSHLKSENVDPQEKPDVAKQYGAQHMGDVIVASGSRKENLAPSAEGVFSEQDATSAILKVTRDKQKTVCFVSGHGEKSLDDDQASGYSQADQGLKKEGYTTKTVNLVSQNGVPSDCDVVVIAGPTQAYFPQETAMLAKYLDGGGKALIEVDPETNPKLDDIFQAWNVNVGNDVVIDASGMGRLLGAGPGIPLVVDYGPSPITKNLTRHMTFFPLARTVSSADKSKTNPETVELLKTSPQSFTTPKLQREVKFDSKTDKSGPLSLGIAASRNDGKHGRVVVIGDSDFAANQALKQASNADFFYNTIDWLAQDENLISIRPKTATNRQVSLTESQAAGLKWLDMFFLPGIVILTGIYIWWKRR